MSLPHGSPRDEAFAVNGRAYRPPPRPVAVICIDGCADEYLDAAAARGRLPHISAMARDGFRGLARAALPTFTNVNNAALVCGVPPAATGISGNYFLDPASGEEVMMNSPRFLRCDTILAAAARSGRKVAMVTAKDKLREILSHGLDGISFSAEKAAGAMVRDARGSELRVEEFVGEPAPAIYSAEASLFVLRAGVALLAHGLADFLYLSLTDYMQHRYAPSAAEAVAFHADIDREIGRLLALGAAVAATADHGMNAKCGPDGRPNVIHVETLLRERFGAAVRVICPITDPYVAHHGALGSAVYVHASGAPKDERDEIARFLLALDGVTEVLDRETAARKLELPADRIGDLMVLSGRDVVLGRTAAHHDLSALEGSLRSHGGRYEEMVPLCISEPLRGRAEERAHGDPRNFDVFDLLLRAAGRDAS